MNWVEVVSQIKNFPSFSFTFSLGNLVVVWITCLLLSTSILGSALPTSKWQSSLLTTNKISLSSLAFAFLSSLQWVSRSPSNHTSSSSRRTSFSVGKNDGRRRRIGSLEETPIDQLQYRGYDKLSRYWYITDAHNTQICPLMKKSWQDPFLLFEYFRFLIKVDTSIFFSRPSVIFASYPWKILCSTPETFIHQTCLFLLLPSKTADFAFEVQAS